MRRRHQRRRRQQRRRRGLRGRRLVSKRRPGAAVGASSGVGAKLVLPGASVGRRRRGGVEEVVGVPGAVVVVAVEGVCAGVGAGEVVHRVLRGGDVEGGGGGGEAWKLVNVV